MSSEQDVAPKSRGYEYIEIIPLPTKTKTPRWMVLNRRWGSNLGVIKWSGQWRQFIFAPEPQCIFSRGCLADIEDRIERAMKEWRATQPYRRKPDPRSRLDARILKGDPSL